jgi:hypothetical protein
MLQAVVFFRNADLLAESSDHGWNEALCLWRIRKVDYFGVGTVPSPEELQFPSLGAGLRVGNGVLAEAEIFYRSADNLSQRRHLGEVSHGLLAASYRHTEIWGRDHDWSPDLREVVYLRWHADACLPHLPIFAWRRR